MPQVPSIKDLPRCPVTAGVSLLAIIITLLWWTGKPVDDFFMSERVWTSLQFWRAFTSVLPHVNFFHLAFNLYWVWTFGAVLEKAFGHFKFAAIVLILAFGSSMAEFAFLDGGVGLSGVGYGFWGMLWALDRLDPRFAGITDKQTNQTFVAWFFICIVLTIMKVMMVANLAHLAGGIIGGLLGFSTAAPDKLKWQCRGALACLIALLALGGLVFWPTINLTGYAVSKIEHEGFEQLDKGNSTRAIYLLEKAAHMRNAAPRTWYNLGVAYQHLNRYEEAAAAFEKAASMPDAKSEYLQAAKEMRAYVNLTKKTR